MSVFSAAFYETLAGDETLTALLATYRTKPAVFTTDPAPDDASLPYVVTAGEVVNAPDDTKTTRGREVRRDVRCYTAAEDSAVTVEAMAERVRALFHRNPIEIEGFGVWLSECLGPIVADGEESYGRIVTVRLRMIEED